MFSQLPLTKITHAGMIMLALMASLPEVVCCCNVSWGPGGLLGGKALCQQRGVAAKSCCHQHATHDESSESNCQDCHCTFSIVSPAPITVPPSVELDQAQVAAAILLHGWSCAAPDLLAKIGPAVDDAGPPLTSVRRCALRQTWLI
jgi:hypothetical protein